MITPRTAASASASRHASAISLVILMLIALRFAGRFMVMTKAAPSVWVRIVSNAMRSPREDG
jgi:hypothetical protein